MAETVDRDRNIVVGISGCSSCGKTTLARLLARVIPGTVIIHEDDYYRPEEQLPIVDGVTNWDCPEALDIPQLAAAIAHFHETGQRLTDQSREEAFYAGVQDWADELPISGEVITAAAAKWIARRPQPPVRLCLLDGFLLYCTELETVNRQLDTRLFLRTRRTAMLSRRAARGTYPAADGGVWADPPGYPESVVWPQYAAAHAYLFLNPEAEGPLDPAALAAADIHALSPTAEADPDLESTFKWALDIIIATAEKASRPGGGPP